MTYPVKYGWKQNNRGFLNMKSKSNSNAQKNAENEMRSKFSKKIGVEIKPSSDSSLKISILNNPIELDGVSDDGSVLVEIFARIGSTSSSRDDKVMSDALKLSLAGKQLNFEECDKYLVFADKDFANNFRPKTKNWRAAAIHELGIIIDVIDLDPETREQVIKAQKEQGESNVKKLK
jgi:hypothetical protein